MAAPVVYKPTGVTFGAIALLGVLSLEENPKASTTMLRSDGAQAMTKAWKEGFYYEVSIRCESNDAPNKITLGQTGALVASLMTQADGQGAVGGGGHTLSFPAPASTGYAMLDDMQNGLPFEGKPTVVLKFIVVEPSGLPSLLRSFV